MSYCILLHTHSSYAYLWPVLEDYIKKYNFKKILTYDDIPINSTLPKNFDNYIKYDGTQKFTGRLIPIINNLAYDYIFIIYDIDIIINIDEVMLEKYIKLIDYNNIDRLCTAVFNGNEQVSENDVALCNLNASLRCKTNHYLPADCSPAIWNRKTLLEFFKLFPNRSYIALEQDKDVIDFYKNKIKCYGIQLTPNLEIKYNRGLTYCSLISFLHITTKGQFLTPTRVYYDYEEELLKILNNYKIDINKIGCSQASKECFNFSRLTLD